MHEGHSPVGWDAWGRPWAFMNIAKCRLEGEDTWYQELPGGRVLIAVLVRHAQEKFFFPSARALLEALQPMPVTEASRLRHPPEMDGLQTRNTRWKHF